MYIFKTYFFARTIVIFILTVKVKCSINDIEPGQCLSRFDYDFKVMQKLLQLEREIQELKQRNICGEDKKVAFMAQLSTSLYDPPVGSTLVFDTVHTNVGNGYKPGPGIFVAPVTGTYSINLVASSGIKSTSSYLHLYIMHNTSQTGYIFLDHNSDRSLLRTTAVVIELKEEDIIYVKIGRKTGTASVAGCCFHTVLSGFLVN